MSYTLNHSGAEIDDLLGFLDANEYKDATVTLDDGSSLSLQNITSGSRLGLIFAVLNRWYQSIVFKSANGDVAISGAGTVGGGLTVTGAISATGGLAIGGGAIIDGLATFNDRAIVNGDATFNGAAIVNGWATFRSGATVSGAAIVNGLLRANSLSVLVDSDMLGALTAGSILSRNGVSCAGDLAVSGGATVSGLVQAGSLTVLGNSNTNGVLSAGSISATGGLNVGGAAKLNGEVKARVLTVDEDSNTDGVLTAGSVISHGGVNAGGRVSGVDAPQSGTDAATKDYVDTVAGGKVSSVNGQTGTVALDADDVGALPATKNGDVYELAGVITWDGETLATHEEVVSTFEQCGTKVTTISSASTDTQYPSAKCVYDAIATAITGAIEGGY